MAIFTFPTFNSEMVTKEDIRDLVDALAKLQKELNWGLYHQDHENVKRLHTNRCDIRSGYGETVIDGPQLTMYDAKAAKEGGSSPGTLRLKMGYDDISGDFLFEMYNAGGVKTVGIDSNGDATFTGTITGSDIIGNNILTGSKDTAHLELTGGGLKGLTSDGLLSGLVFTPTETDIVDIFLYHRGAKLLEFYDGIDGFTIRGASGANYMGIGGSVPTNFHSDLYFNSANSIVGLTTTSDGDPPHTHDVIIG